MTSRSRSVQITEKKEEDKERAGQGIMTRVKKNVEILNYSNTIYSLNWRDKRHVPGYYGCGECGLCRLSIFGDTFKVHHSNCWFRIKGSNWEKFRSWKKSNFSAI